VTTPTYEPNDGRYPDESDVLVLYPAAGADDRDRSTWSWHRGDVLGQCGPDEWHVVVYRRDECTLADGITPARPDTPDHERYYPTAWRSAGELRRVLEDGTPAPCSTCGRPGGVSTCPECHDVPMPTVADVRGQGAR